jgi:hypothetical protein
MEKGCELEGVCTNLGQSLGWREGWGICAAQLTCRYHEQDSEEIRSVTSTILTWLWGVMESSSLKERSVLQKKGSGALIFQILTYLGSFFFFHFLFIVTGYCYVAQADLKPWSFYLSFLSAGSTGILHWAWLSTLGPF